MQYGDKDFLGKRDTSKADRPYIWKSFNQVNAISTNIARAYSQLNLVPAVKHDGQEWRMIAIQSKNREEWGLVNIANILHSVITVGLYDTLGAESTNFIINQCQLTTIICSGDYIQRYIKMKKDGQIKSVQNLVTFDTLKDDERDTAGQVGLKLFSLQYLIDEGALATDVKLIEPTPESVYMFSYTSGTTGDPKGVILTHKNILAECVHPERKGFDPNEHDTIISYLPYAHSYEQDCFCLALTFGMRIGYYSGDVLKIREDA